MIIVCYNIHKNADYIVESGKLLILDGIIIVIDNYIYTERSYIMIN